MTYSVFFHPAARRELSRLRLAGFRNVWRIRVGVYRVIYRIEHARLIVEIIRVGHRREVYRRL